MDLVIDKSLSFSLSGEAPPGIDSICFFSDKKGKYFIQAPKFDKLKEILSGIDVKISLTKEGKESYEKLKSITVDRETRQIKRRGKMIDRKVYTITFPSYPSYPKFANGVNYWKWANLGKKISEKGERPVYEVEYPYSVVEAVDWLKREGYDVTMKQVATDSIAMPRDDLAKITSMTIDPDLDIKSYQIDDVNRIKQMGYKGIIGTDPGLGKTIEAGKIIYDLFVAGLVFRVIWVVPTSPLVSQVLEEMRGRFNLHGIGITMDTMDKAERLGIENGKKVRQSIYERYGFIVVTWATFVKDWAGETYDMVTKDVWIDLCIFDEAHRAKLGNRSFAAILSCVAPYRIMLSGTIMPNGNWEELHDMVSAISPSSCMLKWYLKDQEDKLAEDYSADPDIKNPKQDAKLKITSKALAMLMNRVTRHRTDEVADFLPSMREAAVHIKANKDEEIVISMMIEMLSDIIDEWQNTLWKKRGTDKQREEQSVVESAKNVAWQVTRRYCSHGAFTLRKWIEELDAKNAPVHEWLKKKYKKTLQEIKRMISGDGIRNQPKNDKVSFVISKVKPKRCLVFYDSIEGTVTLARYLKEEGKNVKIVVGKSISKEDADFIGQSKTMKDDDVSAVLEWFWFPWWTVSNFSRIDGVDATYTASDGKRKESIYYVDAHKLGNKFTIDLKVTGDREGSIGSILKLIAFLESSKTVIVTHDVDEESTKDKFNIKISVDEKDRDERILVCTEKMKEGANLQVTDLMIFYDQPMSIRQREQRIGRIKRMQSMRDVVTVVSISMGLDYSIKKSLALKYETAKKIGYEDPDDDVSIQDVIKGFKKDQGWKNEKETTLLDFS